MTSAAVPAADCRSASLLCRSMSSASSAADAAASSTGTAPPVTAAAAAGLPSPSPSPAALSLLQSVRFRLAVESDAPQLSALVNSAYRGESAKAGWTYESDLLGGQRTDAEELSAIIRAEDQRLLLAVSTPASGEEGEDEIVGSVCLQRKSPSVGYIGMLVVKPVLQASGLGRRLLVAGEQWQAHQWGVTAIEMTVIHQRAELIAWYMRRGYADTGRQEAFPMTDVKFGLPKVNDLHFVVLQKRVEKQGTEPPTRALDINA